MADYSKRLKALQKTVSDEGLDALIVPMQDRFQSEYVPECYQRLRWLTGFTGSAGALLVTPKKVVFFTDGRYTIQAKQQLPKMVDRFNSVEKPMLTYIKEELSEGVIGFDAMLHSIKEFEHWTSQSGDQLVYKAVDNLVDSMWIDRPMAASDPIDIYPEKYAGKSMEKKCAYIANKCEADAILITAPDSVCWLLNIRGQDVAHTPLVLCYALLDKKGEVTLFVEPSRVPKGLEVNAMPIASLPEMLKSYKHVQLDPSNAGINIKMAAQQTRFLERKDPCQLAKACKNDVEAEGMKTAHARDGAALVSFMHWLSENVALGEVTEFSASEKLYEFRSRQPLFTEPSFSTISAYAGNGAIVHYQPQEEDKVELKNKGLYLLDSGGQYLDGTTDVTRTFSLGEPSEEHIARYTDVLKGHVSLAKQRFPVGTTGHQLDAIARQHLWNQQCDYAHGTGHGVGSYLGVHEGPQGISSRGNNVQLMPGMVLSNEPGYYKDGEYGIRIENLVIIEPIEKSKYLAFHTLTLAPYERELIDATKLTMEERLWVDEYHARVLEKLTPMLEPEVVQWLKTRCEPISSTLQ